MEETQAFDKAYWERHWRQGSGGRGAANPHVVRETTGLVPGTALDAGCGTGASARWLAGQGWDVTGADISAEALARADGDAPVRWVEADLATWAPGRPFDLVVSCYAHPAMPQLEFYDRLAGWVAPGGTLLIVGHRSGHEHPAEATATAAAVAARLDGATWEIATAEEPSRIVTGPGGREVELHDVVVRAQRTGVNGTPVR